MNKVLSHYNSKYAVWALMFLSVFGVLLYVTLVNVAVLNVAERLELEKSVATLRAETSQLEFTTIALAQEIDLEQAFELGFTETNETQYVVRGGSGAVALGNSR